MFIFGGSQPDALSYHCLDSRKTQANPSSRTLKNLYWKRLHIILLSSGRSQKLGVLSQSCCTVPGRWDYGEWAPASMQLFPHFPGTQEFLNQFLNFSQRELVYVFLFSVSGRRKVWGLLFYHLVPTELNFIQFSVSHIQSLALKVIDSTCQPQG